MGIPGGSEGKVSACNMRDPGSIPGSRRSSGEGNGNPLQYLTILQFKTKTKTLLLYVLKSEVTLPALSSFCQHNVRGEKLSFAHVSGTNPQRDLLICFMVLVVPVQFSCSVVSDSL